MGATDNNNLDLAKLIDQGHMGIILLDTKLRMIYNSPAAQRITGWADSSDAELHITDRIHPADKKQLDIFWPQLTFLPAYSDTRSIRVRHSAGNYIWLECTFTNMLHEGGVAAVVCNFIDVTEKKHNEILLQKTQLEYGQIFNSVPDIICVVGADGEFKKANPAMCHLLEYTCEELLTFNINDLIHPDDLDHSEQRMRSFMAQDDLTLYFENRYITRTGKVKWLAWTATKGSEKERLFCVAKDITERMNYINEIEERNRKFSEIKWLQSHVIRAPLCRIMGLVNMLQTTGLRPDEGDEILQYLTTSANELDEVIKNIVTLSNHSYAEGPLEI